MGVLAWIIFGFRAGVVGGFLAGGGGGIIYHIIVGKLPHVSRRSERLLGPLQNLVLDG